jgi:hypothetical protein
VPKGFLNCAVALVALAATCAFFHAVLPSPAVNEVTPKLQFFAAHKDEFDTVFIGTSRFHYQISPEIFDAETRVRGIATHTFNLGIDGMHPPESFYVIEQFLKLKPRELRWVFLEFEDTQLKWVAEKRGTRRVVHWHDWKRTELALRKSLNPEGRTPFYEQVVRIWLARSSLILHLGLYLQQFGNAGTAADLLETRNEKQENVTALGPRGDGYQPSGDPMQAEQAKNFGEKLARELKKAKPAFVDPYAEKAYRECAQRIRECGARAFFVVPPILTQSPLRFRAHPEAPGPVFAFNDAQAFPEFYRADARVDESHVTRESAGSFTRLVADHFASGIATAR